jgi:hypothetical protein
MTTTSRLLLIILALPIAATMTSCDFLNKWLNPAPDLKFAPYSAGYAAKPDFAQVEYEFPLPPVELKKLTPDNIKNYDQEQVDQIYARLSAGPIPDGAYDGGLFFPKGTIGDRRLSEIVGGLPGLAVELKAHKLEFLGKTLWKGKVFYKADRVLRNRIEDLSILKPLIDGDLASIPKTSVNGKDQWLMFPARLYCGQSLLDSRRESVIIDYFFSDEISGYRERPDYLASRRGFQVRDEIRMVRPGFYLGRAYLGRAFLLNFTLVNKAIADKETDGFVESGKTREDCWTGTQERKFVTAAK